MARGLFWSILPKWQTIFCGKCYTGTSGYFWECRDTVVLYSRGSRVFVAIIVRRRYVCGVDGGGGGRVRQQGVLIVPRAALLAAPDNYLASGAFDRPPVVISDTAPIISLILNSARLSVLVILSPRCNFYVKDYKLSILLPIRQLGP